MKNFKLLGNCQVCGRLQAVNHGMSKHGYTVNNGWFNGICSGENELPMQKDKTVTIQICDNILDGILELENLVISLKSGKIKPQFAPIATFYKAELVPFNDAPKYMQEREVEKHIWNAEARIKAGEGHIQYLKALSAKVYGQELIKEEKPVKAPAIQIGEKRINENKLIVTCTRVEGARVYWAKDINSKWSSWTGTTAWRKLQLVD